MKTKEEIQSKRGCTGEETEGHIETEKKRGSEGGGDTQRRQTRAEKYFGQEKEGESNWYLCCQVLIGNFKTLWYFSKKFPSLFTCRSRC